MFVILFFFFKQKTAYEMRISDWSSDVCSSDLRIAPLLQGADRPARRHRAYLPRRHLQERGRTLPAQRPVARSEGGEPRLCRRALGKLADRRQEGAPRRQAR